MNAINLLSELRRQEIRIWAEGDQLRVNAPDGALTPALKAALRECKQELLALLSPAHAKDDPADSPIPRLSRQERLPLSFAQERLWFLDRLHPDNTVYNVPLAVRLRGVLDVGALERSLRTIVARHEPLRTVFREDLAGTAQVILPAGEWHLGHEAVPDAEAHRESWVHAWCKRVAQEPFDLERGPLFRARLLHVGATDYVLSLAMHHIVADGWSLGVLVRELTALYEAEVGGKQAALPPLLVQYADFAAWQRQWLKGAVLDDQLDYWRRRLMGLGVLELPTDRPRPPVRASRGAVAEQRLGRDLIAGLKAFGQREGATLFMVLLTGFKILLARYSGQDDVAVGTPIANRRRAAVEGLIGFFVNTLVLRTDLGGDVTVREAVKRVRDGALGAYANQDVPFEKLVEALQPVRDGSHTPLFQVLLALQNLEIPRLELPGLTLTPLEIHNGTARCDLTLDCLEEPDGARLTWEYDEALFDGASIERMQGHFERVLETMVADPGLRIREIPLLIPAERRQILVEWNRTEMPYAHDRCLHELVHVQAARTPDAVAVAYEGRGLTYGELERRANQVAHGLRKRGVGPNVLVGIAMERSLELLVGVLGILKAGGAYVPIDPEYPAERVAYMLEDAQVPVLLAQAALRARLAAPGAEVLCLDGDVEWLAGEPTTAPAVPGGPDQLAYVIYTSGSTGRPKGAMNTHRGIHNRLQWMQATYGLTAGDRVLQKTPISFDVSVWELFWPLMTGATLVLARPGGHRDPGYLVETIQRERITVLHFVPSMLQVFLAEPGVEGCGTVRQVICSGEALPYELAQRCMARLPGARLDNLYGPTEAAVDVTWWRCEPEGPRGLVPIGRPVANTQIYIVDGQGQPVPVGVAGELCIGGVQVGRGYWRRPELTAERFVPDRFSGRPGARLYRTGDRARYLADGSIEYLGRLDFQVKLRGFRIELGEIEAVLGQQAGVREAVVIAREDVPGDQRLVAYLVPHAGAELTGAALRTALRTALPEYMVPAAYVVLAALPLTGSGKVDRRALPAPEPAGIAAGREYTAPRSETERAIAGIWGELLGVAAVGIHDNFFALGGHSLLATRVMLRISRQLGVQLPVRRLFDGPTVTGVAEYVEEARRDETQREEAADILSRLDELSDGEVEVLLARLQDPGKDGA